MGWYLDDEGGTQLCIATEEGDHSLCGHHTCNVPIETAFDSIWVLVEEDRLYDDCSCKQKLVALLGFEDADDFEQTATSIRTTRQLRRLREGTDRP